MRHNQKLIAAEKDIDMQCALDDCKKKVTYDRGQSKYCSDECRKIGKSINMMGKNKGLATRECARTSCTKVFEKNSPAQKFCPDCRVPGATYIPETDSFSSNGGNHGDPHAVGIWYDDFRTSICKKGERDCVNFSKCSDTLMEHRHGAFKYQTNGGVDCYEAPVIKLASGYNSIAACSINDGCR